MSFISGDFHHRIRDVLQERRLAGAGRSHDEAALACSCHGRHEVHHTGGVTVRGGLELADRLLRADGGQLLEDEEIAQGKVVEGPGLRARWRLAGWGPRLPRRVSPLIHMPSRRLCLRTTSGVTKTSLFDWEKLRRGSRRKPNPLPETSTMPSA